MNLYNLTWQQLKAGQATSESEFWNLISKVKPITSMTTLTPKDDPMSELGLKDDLPWPKIKDHTFLLDPCTSHVKGVGNEGQTWVA